MFVIIRLFAIGWVIVQAIPVPDAFCSALSTDRTMFSNFVNSDLQFDYCQRLFKSPKVSVKQLNKHCLIICFIAVLSGWLSGWRVGRVRNAVCQAESGVKG